MKLPEVEITDNEWINCCEPLFFERWTDKGKTTSDQLLLITIYAMMKITPRTNTLQCLNKS
jgi:hypothetical protein